MEWVPSSEALAQLAQYLRDSLSAHDKAAQKNAELVRYLSRAPSTELPFDCGGF